MSKLIKVKLNYDLGGYLKDQILTLGSSKTPLDSFWSRRLEDSKIDNCLTIIEDHEEDKEMISEKPKPTSNKKRKK
jgi:hypothetical protein